MARAAAFSIAPDRHRPIVTAGMNAAPAPNCCPSHEAPLPARSADQAMDWSLVLASQGIDSVIEQTPAGWQLRVAAPDLGAARQAVALYEAENRPQPWRQEVLHSGWVFDWASVGWAVVVAAFFWLSDRNPGLREAGVLDAAVLRGEFWRLFTAQWLHADLGHLVMNLATGLPLVGLVMGCYGSGSGLLAALLAGAIGNLATLALALEPHRSLGASGLIMGALGLLAAQGLVLGRRAAGMRRLSRAALAAGVMLFVLMGLSPGTDVVAHAGGFVGGLALGALVAQRLLLARRPWVNGVAMLATFFLTVWTWGLALRGVAAAAR